jgi:hypothetical protein
MEATTLFITTTSILMLLVGGIILALSEDGRSNLLGAGLAGLLILGGLAIPAWYLLVYLPG